MKLSNHQIFSMAIVSIVIVVFNYITNISENYENNDSITFSSGDPLDSNIQIDTEVPINYRGLSEDSNKTDKQYIDIGKKQLSELENNYNVQYHVPEDILKKKYPLLLKADNITFVKDGKKQELNRLPAQNRATYYEPGKKYFISNYVPNYQERILLSKKNET